MNLDELKDEWQNQATEAIAPPLKAGSLKRAFGDQIKAFEQDHNPTAILAYGIVMGVLALLGLWGWLYSANSLSIVMTFSAGGTALFQILRYYVTKKLPAQDDDLKAYLTQSLKQLQWHRFNTYVVGLIAVVPLLGLGVYEIIIDESVWTAEGVIALSAFLILTSGLFGIIYWYQKRFLYDSVHIKQEIQSLLSEYRIN
ncbi:MAG: hypothetical protein AB8H47_07550 [Bacteroidia bacterium]